MDVLLEALNELYNSTDNSSVSEYDGQEYFESCDIVDKAEGLCCEKLIEMNGRCNWDNIRVLRNNGYDVFAGEKDSFGWLTGCVQKDGDPRILVYG